LFTLVDKILKNANKNQGGFTLIELLVAIAITGMIALGLTITIFQVMSGSVGSSNKTEVVRQVQNTGYWISRDGQMAKEVLVDDDPDTPEVITLTWYLYTYHEEDATDRDGDGMRVIYTLEDRKLYRHYYYAREYGYVDPETGETSWIVREEDYELKSTTFIAENISDIYMEQSGSIYKLHVTASIEGWQPESETRIYEVKPRPNIF